MKKKLAYLILPLLSSIIFTACEKKIQTSAHEIHWDRDSCKRCVMIVSDRNQTVQVINPKNGEAFIFDDIGCAILWFKDEKITWEDSAIIWINDIKTSKWINAKTAFYDKGNITPMAYGFGAHEDKNTIKKDLKVLNFKEISKEILNK